MITEKRLKGIISEAVQEVMLERSISQNKRDNKEDVINFNNVLNRKNKKLNESNINRMLHWLDNCDCAFISAFRNELKDVKNGDATYFGPNGDWEEGKEFSHEENRQKNKLMVAELLQLGYGVVKTKGVYPEGLTGESSEESYLVVNRNNDENFMDNLMRIAEYYNQDSIYYKEAGAEEGHLIGTNDCGWPEYHEKGDGSKLKVGTASNYMSRLGNHAFSFVGSDSEETADRKAAMDSIENSKGTDDEWRQRHWTDHDGSSFQARKELRKKNLSEAVSFWRSLVDGKMIVKEDIHPSTRKTMGEAIRKYKAKHQSMIAEKKEIMSEVVQDAMLESSISQKKRNNKDVERFYRHGKNGFNNIKTLVIFTAENPNSTEVKRSQNKKLNKSLLKTLKDAGYKFVPAIGQFYGNPEHPYVIFNMSLETAKRLCGRYEQTSFIWGQLDGNGGVLSQYWEKQDVTLPYNIHHNDYVLKDESNEWTDQSNAEDGFTLVGKHFKYSIPFSIFESVNAKFGENIKQICEQELNNGHTISADKIIDFSINGVGLSPLLYRKAIIKDS